MNKLINLFLRYTIIILAGLGNLALFYKLLTPITTKTVSFILNLFSPTITIANTIIFNSITIQLIPACIAGSAYYLLLILTLTTPNIKLNKTIKILFTSFITLFILNISRIIILTFANQTIYFESLHIIFWYIFSTIFVIAIWIFNIKFYKIKNIPVYSDLKYLVKLINPKHSPRRPQN